MCSPAYVAGDADALVVQGVLGMILALRISFSSIVSTTGADVFVGAASFQEFHFFTWNSFCFCRTGLIQEQDRYSCPLWPQTNQMASSSLVDLSLSGDYYHEFGNDSHNNVSCAGDNAAGNWDGSY